MSFVSKNVLPLSFSTLATALTFCVSQFGKSPEQLAKQGNLFHARANIAAIIADQKRTVQDSAIEFISNGLSFCREPDTIALSASRLHPIAYNDLIKPQQNIIDNENKNPIPAENAGKNALISLAFGLGMLGITKGAFSGTDKDLEIIRAKREQQATPV